MRLFKAVVCRLTQTTDKDTNPCEIIQLIRDDGVSTQHAYTYTAASYLTHL